MLKRVITISFSLFGSFSRIQLFKAAASLSRLPVTSRSLGIVDQLPLTSYDHTRTSLAICLEVSSPLLSIAHDVVDNVDEIIDAWLCVRASC